MSPRGSSDQMAFLRREIARIEAGGAGRPPAYAPERSAAAHGGASHPAAALLSAARLAGGLHEIVPASALDDFAALGFALWLCSACAREKPAGGIVLAIEDFVASETGAPYGPGLEEAGLDVAKLAIVRTQNPRETLRVMEEALKCPAVAVVLAESAIPHRLYSLDASRRLALAARAGGGAGLLAPIALAGAGQRLSSAATTRIEVVRRRSADETFGQMRFGLPGTPIVGVRILKARGASGLDVERVHEVAFDAFSVDFPALPADRPSHSRALRSA
jgi:protein ImuA